MTAYLLDTNHASALLLGNDSPWNRLAAAGGAGVGLCRPSVGELWYMVHYSQRVSENRTRLRQLLREFDVLEFKSAAHEYGRIRAKLQRAGTAFPQIDCQIASIARAQGLVLLTADAHFSCVGDLQTENWLKP